MTLLEMVIAVAMVIVIFAAVLPQFAAIRNSWDSKQGVAEAIQNGRVLMDHISRNLSNAKRITDVSASSVTNGYIQFVDNNDVNNRYDIAANNYVEFGPPGNLSDLAGPVSVLQFTCYDVCDWDTPLSPVTDVNLIRTVKVQTTVTNSAGLAQDKDFTTWAYLRTNGTNQAGLTKGTAFEWDASNGQMPAIVQVDSTHYLCAYDGPDNDGWAVILTANTAAGTVSKGTAFEFDVSDGQTPALVQIDSTHYLCAYTGPGSDGFAVVLTVDTGAWTITKGTAYEYDTSNGETPALVKIDSTHYLCAYTGPNSDGWAVVLTVNLVTWAITQGTAFEYDTSNGQMPALVQVDSAHYLCAYTGQSSRGKAVVLTVNTGTWAITGGAVFEFDGSSCDNSALVQIDSTHYLCAYTGTNSDGWAIVLTVNTGSWTVSGGTAFEFDTDQGTTAALAQIDSDSFLCSYTGPGDDGWAVVLNVDTSGWTISKDTPFEYDTSQGMTPALAEIDSADYLCAYTGADLDGWAVILQIGEGLKP